MFCLLGGSPSYGTGSTGSVLGEEYPEGGETGEGGTGGSGGGGGALPAFSARFGGAFATTSRPSAVYGTSTLTANYTHPVSNTYLQLVNLIIYERHIAHVT